MIDLCIMLLCCGWLSTKLFLSLKYGRSELIAPLDNLFLISCQNYDTNVLGGGLIRGKEFYVSDARQVIFWYQKVENNCN